MSDRTTIDDAWGAVETSRSGNVVLSLDGREYEAPTRNECLLKLTTDRGPQVEGAADPVWMRRYHHAYYQHKIERYQVLRAQIAALRQNQQWEGLPRNEALAIVDAKLARFAAIVSARDAEDRA